MTTKTIGSDGGDDYATLALAEAGIRAAAPISDAWIFNVQNEEITETAASNWDGDTTTYGESATNTITIQPASGAGFADLLDPDSDTLDYGTGARFHISDAAADITFDTQYMRVKGLQWRITPDYSTTMRWIGAANSRFTENLIRNETRAASIITEETDSHFSNNIIIATDTRNTANSIGCLKINGTTGTPFYCINNTLISAKAFGTLPVVFNTSYTGLSTKLYQNMIVAASGMETTRMAGADPEGDYNMAVNALETAIVGANSTTNEVATDLIEDPVAATQTEGIDARTKTDSNAVDFIPEASAHAETPSIDIFGRTRTGDIWCGAMQNPVSAAAFIHYVKGLQTLKPMEGLH